MSIKDLKYTELKKLCARNGLDAKGTTNVLIARLLEAGIEDVSANEDMTSVGGLTVDTESTKDTGTRGKDDIAVIISESGQEVRRYSLESHGEDFVSLAEEYCEGHPNCRIQMEKEDRTKKCPHCGGKL